jgi:hypothetical protein
LVTAETVAAVVSDVGEALLFLQGVRMIHLGINLDTIAVTAGPRAVLTTFDHVFPAPSEDMVISLDAGTVSSSGLLANANYLAPELHVALARLAEGDVVQVDCSKQVGGEGASSLCGIPV